VSHAITTWERGRLDARVGPKQVLSGRMYEDAAIECGAFRGRGRILCIASAGCTAMKLAPDHEVVAVDINPVQPSYAERRIGGVLATRMPILLPIGLRMTVRCSGAVFWYNSPRSWARERTT